MGLPVLNMQIETHRPICDLANRSPLFLTGPSLTARAQQHTFTSIAWLPAQSVRVILGLNSPTLLRAWSRGTHFQAWTP